MKQKTKWIVILSVLGLGLTAVYLSVLGVTVERVVLLALYLLSLIQTYLFGRRQGIQVARRFIRKFGATAEERRQTLLRQALAKVFGTKEVAT